jgi:hypothetical protein
MKQHAFLRTGVLLAVLLTCVLEIGCGSNDRGADQAPEWLKELIQDLSAQPAANPPAVIARYDYRGQTVYYLSPRCCDIPGTLFDANGSILCHPEGGISGTGDDRCPDFLKERRNEQIVWQDDRAQP